MDALLADVVIGLAVGSAYALLAVAIVLVYSGTRVLSIATGEIGAFGLFVGLRWGEEGLPLVGTRFGAGGAALVAVVLGALLGLLIERFVMRPLATRPPLDGLIATLGVALTLALLELRLFGTAPIPTESPVGNGRLELGPASLSAAQLTSLLLAVAVAVGLYLFLGRTRFGLATRAATNDPTVARLLGVKVSSVYVFVWVTAGVLGGAAAALLSSAGTLTPFSLTLFSLRALAGAVIGGLDSLWGAVLGCLLVGVVETVVGRYGDGYRAGAVLLLVLTTLVVRPQGLFGSSRVS